MAIISDKLNKILSAVFGKDVRQALHDGLDAINKETESTTSRQDYLDRKYDEQIKNMTLQDPSSAEIVDMRVAANGKTFEKAGDRLDNFDEQLDNNVQQLTNKINEVATIGTTTEVLQNTTETYIQEKIDDGTIPNLTIGDNSITENKYKDDSVNKSKINNEFENISSNFSITPNSMIDFTGQTIEYGGGDYLNFKTIKHYQFSENIIKMKLNMSDYGCYKFMFYDETKTFISGSGKWYSELSSLNVNTSPVQLIDDYLIINFKKAKEIYPTAKYVSFTFKKDEVIEIYDITKKELMWLDLSNNEIIKDIYTKVNNEFEKPFVIFSFDWYSDMYDKRYQILKGEYGYNATFCLDNQTPNYGLDNSLTREQFNEMIENGWDYALYGGVGDRGTTEESWTKHIKGIIDQKENIGIFNPVMYNTPDNNGADYISKAVKNNGFKLQRCNTNDNLLKMPNQYLHSPTAGVMIMQRKWRLFFVQNTSDLFHLT